MSKLAQLFLVIVGLLIVTINAYVTTFTPLRGNSEEKTSTVPMGYIAGGWSVADTTDPDVIDATNWCVSNEYPAGGVATTIISARKQIVAGTKYALNVAVTDEATNTCSVHVYVVVRKLVLGGVAPDPPYVLLESNTLDTACPTSDSGR